MSCTAFFLPSTLSSTFPIFSMSLSDTFPFVTFLKAHICNRYNQNYCPLCKEECSKSWWKMRVLMDLVVTVISGYRIYFTPRNYHSSPPPTFWRHNPVLDLKTHWCRNIGVVLLEPERDKCRWGKVAGCNMKPYKVRNSETTAFHNSKSFTTKNVL